LETTDIRVQYGGLIAVDGVSVDIRAGEVVGLIGPNGAGKTTFIDAVTGFAPSSGRVALAGTDLSTAKAHQRARAGLVRTWQAVELFDELSVRDNVLVGLDARSWSSALQDIIGLRRHVGVDYADWALDVLGLSGDASRRPSELALGRQKLVGVARALALKPAVVLLDEPAAGLSSSESAALGERLRDVAATGTPVLLVDHDVDLVLDTCSRVFVVELGRVIAVGTPADIRRDAAVRRAYLGEQAVTAR
jgi:ABC-type branched-subunit amino acid transport system ATPase component